MTTTQTLDQFARDLVAREVNVCVSSLVHTLANSGLMYEASHAHGPDIRDLAEQAFELACPIDDYEEAAIQAGWSQGADGIIRHPDTEHTVAAWHSACEFDDIEPYQREVFEHWAVSVWFGRKLAELGEKVDFDFSGMVVWARTTTGQAIYADHVIEQIAKSLQEAR